jgi:hypothetical protein
MAVALAYEQLKASLWARPGARVHAIVDAAAIGGLAEKLAAAALPGWDCLSRGQLSATQARQAAYLAELAEASPFTDWLLRDAPKAHPGWGLVFVSNHALLPVREHCRSLSEVLTPDGERRAWRWWDPEVFAMILPALSPSQLDEFFALGQVAVVPTAARWTRHQLQQGVLASDDRDVQAPTR